MTNEPLKVPLVSDAGAQAAAPLCPYCGIRSEFLPSSEALYRGRDFGPAFACFVCQAWVGVHRATNLPLGRLANKQLRELKMAVHKVFDPLHRDLRPAYPDMPVIPRYLYRRARSRAYRWLAHHMGIHQDQCHVGMFDEAKCQQAIDVILKHNATSASVREWNKTFDKEPT